MKSSLDGMLGRYEYKDERSDKFWQITYDVPSGTYTTEWGRNGRPPQDSKPGLTGTEALKKIQEKIAKGYQLTEFKVGRPEGLFKVKRGKPVPRKESLDIDFYAELEKGTKK